MTKFKVGDTVICKAGVNKYCVTTRKSGEWIIKEVIERISTPALILYKKGDIRDCYWADIDDFKLVNKSFRIGWCLYV